MTTTSQRWSLRPSEITLTRLLQFPSLFPTASMVPQPAGFSAGNGATVQDPVGATAHKAWRRAMPPSPGLPLRPHRLGSARIFSHGELAPTLRKIRDLFCQMARALFDSIITSALLKVISLTCAYSEDTTPVAPLAVSLHCEVP